MDIRIGVTDNPRDISLEVADDLDLEQLKSDIDAAVSGASAMLWITDRRGRQVGVVSAKIAFVDLGSKESESKIGFGAT